jgi:hypothetical protein
MGTGFGCGVRADGVMRCWGWIANDLSWPTDSFAKISRDCGIRASDNSITCWTPNAPTPPSGAFTAIDGYCALRASDERVVCFNGGIVIPFDEPFVALSSSCGIRKTDKLVSCWYPSSENVSFPSVPFESLSGDCGITSAHELVCRRRIRPLDFIPPPWFPPPVPEYLSGGPYKLAAEQPDMAVCGLREADDHVFCDAWFPAPYSGLVLTLPPIPLKTISVGPMRLCGIRASDDKIVCWGARAEDLPRFPSADRYSAIVDSCGIRISDGRRICLKDFDFDP